MYTTDGVEYLLPLLLIPTRLIDSSSNSMLKYLRVLQGITVLLLYCLQTLHLLACSELC